MPMIYPMFRKFIEKGRSLSRSKGTSQGDSRGYKLGSLPGRVGTIGGRQKPAFSAPSDTLWDSKEHIVAGKEDRPASGDEEASLDLPKHHAVGVSFAEGSSMQGEPSRATGGDHRILVTTEYTVTEGTPRGSRSLSRTDF